MVCIEFAFHHLEMFYALAYILTSMDNISLKKNIYYIIFCSVKKTKHNKYNIRICSLALLKRLCYIILML